MKILNHACERRALVGLTKSDVYPLCVCEKFEYIGCGLLLSNSTHKNVLIWQVTNIQSATRRVFLSTFNPTQPQYV